MQKDFCSKSIIRGHKWVKEQVHKLERGILIFIIIDFIKDFGDAEEMVLVAFL